MKRPSLVLTLVLCLLAMSLPQLALAQCSAPFEQGKWINNDSATRGITRIEVTFSCNDQVLCGVDENGKVTCSTPGAPFRLHLWGKCHPSDCDWNEVGAQRIPAGHIYAFYDQGFAKRYVYAKMSIYRPGQLWLYIWTDFTDPARPDYASNNWFRRE
jgi:hypothetical protein